MKRSSICTPTTWPNTTWASSGSPSISLSRHDLQQLAFERAGRGGDARRLDEAARRGLKAGLFHLVGAARHRRRGHVHRLAQIPGRKAADEFAGLLDEGDRILVAFAGEHHHRRAAVDAVEIGIGREIDLAGFAHRGDPADRPRRDDGLERIVRQAVVFLARVVEHLAPVSKIPSRPICVPAGADARTGALREFWALYHCCPGYQTKTIDGGGT